jgi:predicted transcriptional regulator
MKQVYFTLDQVLRELDISPNYLSKVSGVRPATIYSIQSNTIKRLNVETLNPLLNGLNNISIEKGMGEVHIHDIINSK